MAEAVRSLDDFFNWGYPQKRGFLHVCPVEDFDEFALVRAEYRPEGILHFVHSSGRVPYDIVTTELPVLKLISDRLVEVLKRHELTGWQTYRVQVLDRQKNEVPGYHGLQVYGRCGPVDYSLSPRVMEPPFPGAEPAPTWKGYYFDPATWDGSDLFIPESANGRTTVHAFVTRRLKEIFEKEKITNVEFEPVKEVSGLFPR